MCRPVESRSGYTARPRRRGLRPSVVRAEAAAVVLACGLAVAAPAETRSVYGVPVKVDAVVPVDESLVEVRFAGRSRIVPSGGVDGFVAEAVLSGPKTLSGLPSGLSADSVVTIARSAARAGDARTAAAALRVYLSAPATGEAAAVGFLESVGPSPEWRGPIREVLTGGGAAFPGPVLAALLYHAGVAEPEWLRQNVSETFYRAAGVLRPYTENRFFAALAHGGPDAAAPVLRLYALLAGEDDARLARLLSVKDKVALMLRGVERGEPTAVYPVLDLAGAAADDGIKAGVAGFFVAQAERFRSSGKPAEAVLLLSRVPPGRDEERVGVVLSGVLSDHGDPVKLLETATVRSALLALMTRRPDQRDRIERLYSRSVEEALGRGELDGAATRFDELASASPGGSPVVDSLRLRLARAHSSEGMDRAAADYLRGMGGGLGFVDRVRASLLRVYLASPGWPVLLLLFSSAAALAGFYAARRIRASTVSAGRSPSADDQGGETTYGRGPRFVRNVAARPNVDPLYAEYCESLGLLGLPPDAPMRMVKDSYRRLIKDLHPDTRRESATIASDRFLKIQQAYERVTELDKEYRFSERRG